MVLLTLNAYVNVILGLLGLASILIGLGEGVCEAELAGSDSEQRGWESETLCWKRSQWMPPFEEL